MKKYIFDGECNFFKMVIFLGFVYFIKYYCELNYKEIVISIIIFELQIDIIKFHYLIITAMFILW